jgi:hypothetical protein
MTRSTSLEALHRRQRTPTRFFSSTSTRCSLYRRSSLPRSNNCPTSRANSGTVLQKPFSAGNMQRPPQRNRSLRSVNVKKRLIGRPEMPNGLLASSLAPPLQLASPSSLTRVRRSSSVFRMATITSKRARRQVHKINPSTYPFRPNLSWNCTCGGVLGVCVCLSANETNICARVHNRTIRYALARLLLSLRLQPLATSLPSHQTHGCTLFQPCRHVHAR